MRRRVSRCLLLALLAVFSAAPAAASPIVGNFFFERITCEPGVDDPCEFPFQFEHFGLIVDVDQADLLVAGLTFSAYVKILTGPNPNDFTNYEFFASGITENLQSPFTFDQLSLILSIHDVARYSGTLDLVFTDPEPSGNEINPTFSAQVVYSESGSVPVSEAPSWLVVVIGFSVLAVGRTLLT